MSLRKLMLWLSACLLLCCVVAVAPSGELLPTSFAYAGDDDDDDLSVRTVRVDCSRGKSINKALLKHKNADELIIEIDGICDEDVLVRRDNVTLLGINLDEDSEPEDGIRAVSTDPDAPPNFGVALLIRDAQNVTVENLILTGGALHGLRVLDSGGGGPFRILVKNCRLENNDSRGLAVARAGVRLEDTVITGNDGGAITMNKSNFLCENCFIEGRLIGRSHSVLDLDDSELVGSFRVDFKSLLRLDNTDQTANPDGNALNNDSQLTMRGGSTTIGLTRVREFSTGVFREGTTHTGDLMCSTGSDVVCGNPATQIIGGTSDCSQCPAP